MPDRPDRPRRHRCRRARGDLRPRAPGHRRRAPGRAQPDFLLADVAKMAIEVGEAAAAGTAQRRRRDAGRRGSERHQAGRAESADRRQRHRPDRTPSRALVRSVALEHEDRRGGAGRSVRRGRRATGIDANDYSGPVVERTGHRAGVVKIAGSAGGPSPRDARIFAAAADDASPDRRPDPDPLRGRNRRTRAAPAARRPRRAAAPRHAESRRQGRGPGLSPRAPSRRGDAEYDQAFRWGDRRTARSSCSRRWSRTGSRRPDRPRHGRRPPGVLPGVRWQAPV